MRFVRYYECENCNEIIIDKNFCDLDNYEFPDSMSEESVKDVLRGWAIHCYKSYDDRYIGMYCDCPKCNSYEVYFKFKGYIQIRN